MKYIILLLCLTLSHTLVGIEVGESSRAGKRKADAQVPDNKEPTFRTPLPQLKIKIRRENKPLDKDSASSTFLRAMDANDPLDRMRQLVSILKHPNGPELLSAEDHHTAAQELNNTVKYHPNDNDSIEANMIGHKQLGLALLRKLLGDAVFTDLSVQAAIQHFYFERDLCHIKQKTTPKTLHLPPLLIRSKSEILPSKE